MADHTVNIDQDAKGNWSINPYDLPHVQAKQTIEWTTNTTGYDIEVSFQDPVIAPKKIKVTGTGKVIDNPVKKEYFYNVTVDGKPINIKIMSAPGIIIE